MKKLFLFCFMLSSVPVLFAIDDCYRLGLSGFYAQPVEVQDTGHGGDRGDSCADFVANDDSRVAAVKYSQDGMAKKTLFVFLPDTDVAGQYREIGVTELMKRYCDYDQAIHAYVVRDGIGYRKACTVAYCGYLGGFNYEYVAGAGIHVLKSNRVELLTLGRHSRSTTVIPAPPN